ncbi:MAG: 3-deoxy-D-manno-octulosonic acid transferase [Candidatus Omnitrophica bacterium]|nr:3-deoxy-D-manno-octulosonic acid transferase [Candidatus Omnitrophota bacterium]
MFILYDLIFLLIAIISLPRYLYQRKFHQGFIQRLGILPKGLDLNRPFWIHAVSVGEVMAVKGLVEALRENYPDKKIVISTVTPTGNKIALKIAEGGNFVTYLPLDFSFIIRGVVKQINPALFILAETEIWPNLITTLFKLKVPIILVNGRISDSSFLGYRAIKFLLKSILNKISVFCVQSELDARRFIALGVLKDKIHITGNMKFDLRPPLLNLAHLNLRLKTDEQLLVCGSTHHKEEEIILGVYQKLLTEFPKLRLLIAPRHLERVREIENLISCAGFIPHRLSNNLTTLPPHSPTSVFILDTIGQLLNYYALADIVFVGGSLVKIGGHNLLEPAAQGKAVIFGPYMFNFRDIAYLFLRHKAAIQIHNPQELKEQIRYLLNNPKAKEELAQAARAVIIQNQGATLRNLKVIRRLYAPTSL